MTTDPAGAKRFYDHVAGWTIEAEPPGPADYRMISTQAGLIGGVLGLGADMLAAGARPAWLPYFSVEDVDATASEARARGGSIFVPPRDIPGIGRFALLADPQHASFYIMRAAQDETPPVFGAGAPGRCGWNELNTPALEEGIAFYAALFGWENRETMNMGPLGGYHFLDLGSVRLGAAAATQQSRAYWSLYFNVASIAAAVDRVAAAGGRIDVGPHEVPTGEHIVLGTDPQGAGFALVGSK